MFQTNKNHDRRCNQQPIFLSNHLDHDMNLHGGIFITEHDNADEHLLMFSLEQLTVAQIMAETRRFPLPSHIDNSKTGNYIICFVFYIFRVAKNPELTRNLKPRKPHNFVTQNETVIKFIP